MLEREVEQLNGPIYLEYCIHIFQSINFLQTLRIPYEEVEKRQVELKFKKPHCKKLLIFDLDETLSHCVRRPKPETPPHVYLDVIDPKGITRNVGFNIRPYTKEVLEAANKHFEVAVFTASHEGYANNVINYIDPTGELIQHRFFRHHCILQDDVYVKDLRIFKNVHLKDILIVDNAVYSFGDQIENGIPITPFKEDPRDTEFLNLIKYLEKCAEVNDVREINKKAFQLKRIFNTQLEPFI